ncbi:MAG: hypothetical protein P8L16_00720, partial [Ilumatobacter sp.]|nr:hypothetical protein [Ilumatobacter sp.]
TGGGAFNFQGPGPTFTRCEFTGNTAGSGGGLYNWGSAPVISESIFQDNTGGGIISDVDSAPRLADTRVCGNTAEQITGAYTDNGGNCISEVCLDCDTCPGDLVGDGDVGGADLTILLNQWGCTGEDCTADLDGNGTVDGADLTVILSRWGACSN